MKAGLTGRAGYIAGAAASFGLFFLVQANLLPRVKEHLWLSFDILLIAAAFSLLFTGAAAFRRLPGGRRDAMLLAGAAVLAGTAFHALIYAGRYGYAPPTTNIIALVGTAPLMVTAFLAVTGREGGRSRLFPVAAGTLALFAVLGSWEKPSTLAPFARYPLLDTYIVLAALAFACGALLLAGMKEKDSSAIFPRFMLIAAAAGLAGPLLAGEAGGPLTVMWQAGPAEVAYAGLFLAGFYFFFSRAMLRDGAVTGGLAFLILPVFLTLLHAVDQSIGFWGESPFRLVRVIVGCLLILAVNVKCLTPEDEEKRAFHPAWRWAAISALALSTAGMFLPILQTGLSGTLDDGTRYTGIWTILAAQSVGGWLALLLSAHMAQSLFHGTYGPRRAILALLAAASLPIIGATPLAYWTDRVPSEILHALETEYVTMSVADAVSRPLMDPFWLLAVLLLFAMSFALLILAARQRPGRPPLGL